MTHEMRKIRILVDVLKRIQLKKHLITADPEEIFYIQIYLLLLNKINGIQTTSEA